VKTGVYVCRCAGNISGRLNEDDLLLRTGEVEGVEYVVADDLLCSQDGLARLREDLARRKPDRVVIAACSPRDHEGTFRRAMDESGLNPFVMQMANVREMAAWVTEGREAATEKALSFIRGAVRRAELQVPIEKAEIEARTDVLVIGAGPSGLKAALVLAEAGRRVVVVEKSPFIGGLPVLFEEVAPRLECGPCMLEPMMDEVLHGPHAANIELMTLAEVTGVLGYFGNFIASIHRSPRRVSADACIGCGECVAACPASIANEYDAGLGARKAIAFPFPGALPNLPFIDARACVRLQGGECSLCVEACPVEGAVAFDEEVETVTREVGAVVVAVGGGLLDMSAIPALGYGASNVYTSLEFERLLAANGPTGGQLRMRQGGEPRSIAIVQCAGSLEEEHASYCSGICCQTAFKFNLMVGKHIPGISVTHFVKEIVVPGKEEAALYRKARDRENTTIVRYGRNADLRVSRAEGGTGPVEISFVDITGRQGAVAADMVVLCPPVVPGPDAVALGRMLDIRAGSGGFFSSLHEHLDATRSGIKGVYIAGACHAPVGIQHAIDQGMAAAGHILAGLMPGRKIEVSPMAAVVDSARCGACGVCLGVCPYGAIAREEEGGRARIVGVLCQGCGTCVAACPCGAIAGGNFTSAQVAAEIAGVLS
jgi:heterodisulfide reductase subunit A